MKPFLMHRDRDFEFPLPGHEDGLPWNTVFNRPASSQAREYPRRKPAPYETALLQDLELKTLFDAMAVGDEFLFEVVQKAIMSGLTNDLDTILYRQYVLRDCINNSAIIKEMYDVTVASIDHERRSYFSLYSKYPSSILHSAIELIHVFEGALKKLKQIADQHGGAFYSEGFARFFAMLQRELADEYFALVQEHLRELKFRNGVLISAELGKGNKGIGHVLREQPENRQSWIERLFAPKSPAYTFQLHPRDESGARALSDIKARGINLVANALGQSAEHILNFFKMLRIELAFYMGCLNLHAQLAQMVEPTCFPLPLASGERSHSFTGLYDVCLALSMKRKVVGNDLNAHDKNLVMITGANQGGKSTFLRSIGLAQLMMQAGMFTPAESFCANLCDRLFTHYKREEDSSMQSGKFDEELSRMSEIVDRITPNSMLLFNESFAATNEKEGAEIARQIVSALLENRVKAFFVTHLYEFARSFYDRKTNDAIFLRAERRADGTRTFKVIEGEPLQTSYGKDLYQRIFEADRRE